MRAAIVLIVASAVACGGSRGFDGTTYRRGPVAFKVPPAPATWRAIDVPDATLAFRDDAHDASILVNARCGQRGIDVPLAALRNHLLAGTTDREIGLEETVPFDEREAMHSRLTAKLDGVPMRYDTWVLKKDACVYDFVYVASPAKAEVGELAFDQFVRGFATLPRGSD